MAAIAAAARLPSRFALPALLAIRYSVDVTGKPWVPLTAKTLDAFGFDKHAKARALRELEGAGLIRVKRQPGRPVAVSLAAKRGGGGDAG